jgi:hypothetical protein
MVESRIEYRGSGVMDEPIDDWKVAPSADTREPQPGERVRALARDLGIGLAHDTCGEVPNYLAMFDGMRGVFHREIDQQLARDVRAEAREHAIKAFGSSVDPDGHTVRLFEQCFAIGRDQMVRMLQSAQSMWADAEPVSRSAIAAPSNTVQIGAWTFRAVETADVTIDGERVSIKAQIYTDRPTWEDLHTAWIDRRPLMVRYRGIELPRALFSSLRVDPLPGDDGMLCTVELRCLKAVRQAAKTMSFNPDSYASWRAAWKAWKGMPLNSEAMEQGRTKTMELIEAPPAPLASAPADPLSVQHDGVQLGDLLTFVVPWTSAQRAAVSAHWSVELRRRVARQAEVDSERATSVRVAVDPDDL